MKYSELDKIVEYSISKERNIKPDTLMNNRILAAISNHNERKNTVVKKLEFRPVWQNIAVVASISIAIALGILAGSSVSSNTLANNTPEELVYLNDGAMESLNSLGLLKMSNK